MSEKNILVPIKIETLVVDEITARQAIWKDLSLDYLAISKRLGVQLEPGELRQLQSSLYKKGAHLHWALPAALTNGIYIDSKMVFPAVPNRWLIIRTHKTDNKPAATKSWIIESDYVKGTTQFVILNDAGSFENTKIGKATELKDWTTEAPQLPDPLTAFAPGNPAFAAIYSSCKDVFGFHDNLNDIDKGTISYMVSGWYSDKAINPLNSAQKGVRDNIISKWSLGIKEEFPADILCHGFIHTIDWDKNKPYELLEKNAAVNIGVGYTAVEAKAAQIARQTGAAEKLLSAYFYDILKNIEGASEIESLADSRAFSSVDGGVLWEIKRSERSTKENDKELKKNEFPDERENPGLAGYFKELNSEQRKCDSLKAKKISMQAEFRALSDKIIRNSLDNKANETILRSIETILTGKRDQLRKEIDIIFLQLSTALNKIKELKNQISAYAVFKPAASGQKPEFELLEGKYPRFWRPNDPVTVFSGAGVRKSEKYKSAGSPETLQCRVPSEIISSIVLYNENAIGQKTITPKPIKLEVKALNTSLTPERISLIEKLYSEASLLDPTRTIERANEYYDRLTEDNELVKALGNSIRSVLNGTIDGNNVNIRKLISSGGTILEQEVKDKISIRTLADKLGIQKWKHPWTPVYMIWYARWTPSYTIENKKQVYCNNDWVWKDKKYLYKGKGIKEEGTIQYSGKAILTDGINNILAARLADGQSDHNISQALASFSDALLMRQQAIQLPLLKKEGANLLRDRSLDPYLTTETYFSPEVNSQPDAVSNFFPVRAGHVRITHLYITDAFGQVQKIIDTTNNNEAKEMITAAKGTVYTGVNLAAGERVSDPFTFRLSPRIIQPSRLLFRWMNAAADTFEESTTDPATTPLCGWVLPDFLSRSLVIYDASGKGCGSVSVLNNKISWQAMPGADNAATPAGSINNRFLLDFVNGLLNNSSNTKDKLLTDFFDLCIGRANYISSSSSNHYPGIAGLTGQPLALVRAALKFELLGLPAQPQNWTEGYSPEIKDTPTGLAGIQFPVSLGDTRNSKDGLIGYYTDAGFDNMRVSFGSDLKDKNSYFVKEDIALSFSPGERQTGLTLLIDPRGGVQADCGILPSKYIDLPAVYKEDSVKNIALHLLVAPFLSLPDAPEIPVSTEQGSHWLLLQNKAGNRINTEVGKKSQLEANSLNRQAIMEGYLVLKKDRTGK